MNIHDHAWLSAFLNNVVISPPENPQRYTSKNTSLPVNAFNMQCCSTTWAWYGDGRGGKKRGSNTGKKDNIPRGNEEGWTENSFFLS